PFFKVEWIVYNYKIFNTIKIFQLRHKFFDIQVIKIISEMKKSYIIKKLLELIFDVAFTLHNTKDDNNRIKALNIFKELKNNYWLGYYHDQGYGGLKIDKEKAMEYYKISVHQEEGYPDAINRYAFYLLNTSKRDENDENKKLFEVTELIRKSAELKDVVGCYNYGDILYNGKLGNVVDKEKSLYYLQYA
ncbi:10568_t:CDS:1, partial [Scutellospora calospora]